MMQFTSVCGFVSNVFNAKQRHHLYASNRQLADIVNLSYSLWISATCWEAWKVSLIYD